MDIPNGRWRCLQGYTSYGWKPALRVCTGGNRVVAVDAENGALNRQFDPLINPEHLAQARYFTTDVEGFPITLLLKVMKVSVRKES